MYRIAFIYLIIHHAAFGQLQNLPSATMWMAGKCTRKAKEAFYKNDCIALAEENKKIPKKTADLFRIATYNTHVWTDTDWNVTFNEQYEIIKNINADIILLQETNWDPQLNITQKSGRELQALFEDLGYVYQEYCHAVDFEWHTTGSLGSTGNLILSKVPLKNVFKSAYHTAVSKIPSSQRPDPRSYIYAEFTLPHNKTITILTTHLDVWDETETIRTAQIREILDVLQHNTSDLIVIGADFNAVRKKDYPQKLWETIKQGRLGDNIVTHTEALETLEAAGFVDSFTGNMQKTPQFTVWAGITIDFLFLKNKNFGDLQTKSYVYYTAASDHIPVVMDILL